jgi:EAL domain-containing protein (putative c-di-GMP-specific phosphodiesterase class I)
VTRSDAPARRLPLKAVCHRSDISRVTTWISEAADTELERALHLDEFDVVYQPMVDLKDGRVCGAEALLRWNHPRAGLLWPGDFLPLVVDEQLIVRIGRRVIQQVAGDAGKWLHTFTEQRLTVAVNLSRDHFDAVDLPSHLANLVHSFGFEPGVLAVEIPRTTLGAPTQRIRSRVEAITATGVEILVDDFGKGWSTRDGASHEDDDLFASLRVLDGAPISGIKIERNLFEDDNANPGMLAALVEFVHEIGMIVYAKGVQTSEEAARLAQAGCDRAQGYLYHRPQPADYMALLLREQAQASA